MNKFTMSFKSTAKMLNDLTMTDYYIRLMLLARSVFEWKNLDKIGIDEKHIEKYLFSYGKCMLFKDRTLGYIVTKCTENSPVNYYDDPTYLKPNATNYINTKNYNVGEECVLIRNNDEMIPTSNTIKLFAYRLTEIDRTIDTNIKLQKTSSLIQGSNKQILALKTLFSKWEGNEPLLFADKNIDLGSLNVLKTDAPIVFDKLQIQKSSIWNEAMSFLGINNANTDKRERLVDDEVRANNEQIELSARVMLKARKKACDDINKLLNLEGENAISVDLREGLREEFGLSEGSELEKEVV